MDTDTSYKKFKLKNQEFTFDVDVSKLPCGINGALYFVEMEADGGAHYAGNNAGAKYGTGYCDAQCPHDIKFIAGEANVIDWRPNPLDLSNNMGIGKYGACCAEMVRRHTY
jgi:cellulose 1,4-beta-cellobiosidase